MFIICGAYETTDCPNGVETCDTIFVFESCFIDNCIIDIQHSFTSCEQYTFFSTNGVQLDWTLNNVPVASMADSYEFNPTEAGTYHICGEINNPNCAGFQVCDSIVISPDHLL